MYGYRCEFCDGIVQSTPVKSEAFKHREGTVSLEDLVIGVCERCGRRYYSAAVLHKAHEAAVDLSRHKGRIKLGEGPLEFQKRIRNEWP
ncbi:MAG: YgiT-type zinc finger protein [Candidatus Hydrogenedentes bacterium]|nr:YgiT-type zinc finger protein [Candidatus Hydrogenedentota bacterium]